jgi:hypothetical protein
MSAQIAWLDSSAEEQRRVREIIQLFSKRESVDELGGRRIVVALSDALFPGTSVLHTRARYLLFIPWLVKRSAGRKDPLGSLDWFERRLIKAFLESTDVDADRIEGLIGRQAGPTVKQLPSTAYWTALEEWGILRIPGTAAATLERLRSSPGNDEPDELAERADWVWHPGVGDPPSGFPDSSIAGGFRLTPDEARWLQERWLATTGDTLLTHLAANAPELSDSWAPWVEPACLDAPLPVLSILRNAERFSLAMAGARQLYQLLLLEEYQKHGFNQVDVDPADTRAALDVWASEVDDQRQLFDGWDPNEFWDLVIAMNQRIDPGSRKFFNLWFDRMRAGEVTGVADDATLRLLVRNREGLKRGNARLGNPALLAGWQGGEAGRVTFRWAQVHRLIADLREGLDGNAGT